MSPRRCLTTGMILIVLLSVPRESAAFFAWIHEMSGPPLFGVGLTCKVGLQPFGGRSGARILRIVQSEGRVVETVYAHGLIVGDEVEIKFHSNPLLLGRATIVEILSATRFAVNMAIPSRTRGTGGEVNTTSKLVA